MRIINSLEELAAIRAEGGLPTTFLDLVEERMRTVIAAFHEADAEWSAEEFGSFVVVEDGDGPEAFELAGVSAEGGGLVGATWELAYRHEGISTYEVLVLFSNDGGNTFFLPDEPWLPAELAAKLADEAMPSPAGAGPAAGERVPS